MQVILSKQEWDEVEQMRQLVPELYKQLAELEEIKFNLQKEIKILQDRVRKHGQGRKRSAINEFGEADIKKIKEMRFTRMLDELTSKKYVCVPSNDIEEFVDFCTTRKLIVFGGIMYSKDQKNNPIPGIDCQCIYVEH